MSPIDDEIIRLRDEAKLTRQQIARTLQVKEYVIDEAITRLIAEGGIVTQKGFGGAPKLEREIEARWGKRDPNIPPARLPEGDAAYDEAMRWLRKWGINVGWRRIVGRDMPEIDGRLTHVGELVERYFDERRKWAGTPSWTTRNPRCLD